MFRLLVVEDDPVIRKLLHRQLRGQGFSVDVARDGKAAYSLWAGRPYDLILTDFSMPDMNGFELAAKIRGAGRIPASQVPIIAITGHTPDEVSRCSAAGIDDVVSKPVARAELRRVLERWLPDSVSLRPPAEIREDPAILRSITNMFVKRIPGYMQALDLAFASGSRADIAAAAHKLKSAAQLVGGSEVARFCTSLEERSGEADGSEITRLQQRIREALERLKRSLKSSGPNQHSARQ